MYNHCKNHGDCGHNHNKCKGHHYENRCNNNQGKGKRRELFEKKYTQYLSTVDLPEFETDEEYNHWLQTEKGKSHVKNIETIWTEVDSEIPWGGKRKNAGRPKICIRKISYTRRLSQDILEKLKSYAKENNLTETEALEKAILNL